MQLERAFVWSDPLRKAPVLLRYLIATLVILAFCALRWMVGDWMGGYPFLLFFPAIILISVFLDRGTGIYAVIFSAVLAWHFFIPQHHAFSMSRPKDAVPLALYVMVALFVAFVVEALRSTAERLAHTAEKLERSSELNRLLLLDVNHRVKNHLASVSGLLRLSVRQIDEPRARQAIENAVGRINVLGQVYSRLHLAERATVVPSRDFIVSLCQELQASVFGVRPVALRVQAQDVPLSSTQAVPIGLIINELVENALKYAFPDERGGDIRVEFEALGDILVLTVADNGIGMSPTRKTGGGTRIIGSLVQQLGGQLEQGAGPGTTVAARFPRQAPAEM